MCENLMIAIEVTNRCNLSCPYCIRMVDKPEPKDMTPKEFNHVLKQLMPYRTERVALSGLGEPLVNPYFIDMLNDPLLKRFQKLDFSTNGTLLTQETIRSLIDSRVIGWIRVSLQSSRKEVMETLQRGAKFEQVVANTKNLISYARERGSRTRIYVQHLKTRLNPDESEEDFQKILGTKFVKGVSFSKKVVSPASMGLLMPSEGQDVLIRGVNRSQDACRNVFGISLIITAHGDLAGCCWDCTKFQTYGNIFENSLKELRSSELLKSLREELVNRDFHRLPVCRRCLGGSK